MNQDIVFYVFNEASDLPQKSSSTLVAQFDGAQFRSLAKLYVILNKEFQFGGNFGNNLDALFDSMTDLSWLNEKKFAIVIRNTDEFLSDEDDHTMIDFLNTLNDIGGSINDEPLISEQNRSMRFYFEEGKRIEDFLDESYVIWEAI